MPLPTKAEKRRFVRDLTNSIRDEVIRKINEGRVPADWDGIELRLMLAEKFQHNTVRIMGQRKKAYDNAFLVDANL